MVPVDHIWWSEAHFTISLYVGPVVPTASQRPGFIRSLKRAGWFTGWELNQLQIRA